MDFTREPIVETIITPREGYRLVVRSSKSTGHEEHFVDAVEVISFGNAFFFRSVEKPKPFVVPVSDYEVLEVREPRIVLKTAHAEGAVKIAGGRKAKAEAAPQKEAKEPRGERRRDKRRSTRRRRIASKEVVDATADKDVLEPPHKLEPVTLPEKQAKEGPSQAPTLLPPPTTLIRDDLVRLRESEAYKAAFFEEESSEQEEQEPLREEKNAFEEEETDPALDVSKQSSESTE